jgi:aryl-alcohol dehydrogenase-like predicted oxidoreductase
MREEEREMFGLLDDQGVACLPWSPLAGGTLARPWGEASTARGAVSPTQDAFGKDLFRDGDEAVVGAVQQVAEARGVSMAQVAMAWVLRNPVVTAPIVGPTKPHHLTDAVAAVDLELTDDEVQALEEHYTTRTPTWFA